MSLSEVERLLKDLGLTERDVRELTTISGIALLLITNVLERIENYLLSGDRVEKLINAFNKIYEKLPKDLPPEVKAEVTLTLLFSSRELIDKYLKSRREK